MANFQYIASNPQGQSVRGTLPAVDKAEVAKKLKQQGLFLISCRSDDAVAVAPTARPMMSPGATLAMQRPAPVAAAESPAAPLQAWWSHLKLGQSQTVDPKIKPKGQITLKELTVLTRQISISINAGMSFVDALQSMVQHARNPMVSWVLRNVLDDVLSGKKFSEALGRHPDIFRPVYVSMAAAGESGGFMPEALNRVAEFLEKEMELKAKIKSAMVYPAVIAVVATLVVIGMMIFIVPTFVHVFEEMNAPLPLPTKILIEASAFVRHGGFITPVAFIVLIIFLKKLRNRNEPFRRFWDQRVLELPLFGKLATLEIITRFIRTLSSLVDNGVMALEALGVARQVVENRCIERVVDDIYSSVQQGNGISPVLYKSKYFPVLVANMVATGEKTGAIPEVLTKMADYYDAEVAAAVRDILTMMEPLMIVVMAIIVGFIIAGLMLPTFQMSSLVK